MIIRIVAGSCCCALLALQYRLWVSADGMREVWRLEQAIATQRQENERLRERNRDARGRSARPQGRAHGDRGTGAHRPRHDRRERDVLPGRAAGRVQCATPAPDPAPGRHRPPRDDGPARRWAVVPAAGPRRAIRRRYAEAVLSRCSAGQCSSWSMRATARRARRSRSRRRARARRPAVRRAAGRRATPACVSCIGGSAPRAARSRNALDALAGDAAETRLGAGARRRATRACSHDDLRRLLERAGARSASAVCWPCRSATR